MMSKIHSIANYNPTAGESFFVDANVWLFLCYPKGNYKRQEAEVYSNFIDKARRAGAKFYTSSQVLSEFVNRCLRNDFQLRFKNTSGNKDFKRDFRDTTLYTESLEQTVLPSIKNILKLSHRCPDNFDVCNFDQLLDELRIVDFNDACHLQVARRNNWILITHDGDFGKIQDESLTIVTALPRLLRAG
jgi:predicted nucleic acid-binding protein